MGQLRHADWLLVAAIVPLFIFGLFTMKSLGGNDYFFNRQLIWIAIGFVVMVLCMFADWRMLKSSSVLLLFYAGGVGLLILLSVIGRVVHGAQSWISLGEATLQPVELVKFFLILLFAKYFSGRHIEIALMRHIVISFLYLLVPLVLILMQPDLGSASILFFIWVCMVLFSGMTLKQIGILSAIGILVALLGWGFLLKPYQRTRIITFLSPESDPRGSGYHAIQAMIAVGSGGVWGKGVGYGTQSRLNFLPESQTDFIFAAFAEEWGLVGVSFIFLSFSLIFWRILRIVIRAPDNFSKLFGLGVTFLMVGHIIINVGMNVGLLPITGIGLPFMSYGGSLLLVLMASLGLLESIAMRSSIKGYADEGSLVPVP